MKFHLPKKLLVAVMSTFAISTVQAGLTLNIQEIINVSEGDTIAIESDAERPSTYVAIAKDGLGTATVTGSVTKYTGIYVREGELQIGCFYDIEITDATEFDLMGIVKK